MKTTHCVFGLIMICLFSCKKENNNNNNNITDKLLGQKELSNASFTNIPVSSIAVDITGAKWIGTDAGLFLLKKDKFYEFSYFNERKINSVIKNKSNMLVSTSLGAYTIEAAVNSTSLVDSLNKSITGVNDITVYGMDIFNQKWIGSPDGLAYFNDTIWKWNDEIRSNLGGVTDVSSMAFRANDCFFGTYGNFLYHIYYKSSGNVDAITGASKLLGGAPNPANNYNGELTTDTIFCLFASSDGAIWFGSTTGLTRNIGGTKSQSADGVFDYFLREQRVHSVLETSGKEMWAGTENGIYVKTGSNWTNYTISNGLPGNIVYCIAEDTDLTIWVGTNQGIAHFVNNKWEKF